jgi:hypothetical protein
VIADEGLHEPGLEPFWNESWYFDFAEADGSFGGYVRIGLSPNRKTCWYLLCLVGRDSATVRIDDKQLPLSGLAVVTDAYRFDHGPVGTDGTWRIHGAGRAESGDPVDLLAGRSGTAVGIAVDLTWTVDGLPFTYDVTTRYEIPCLVSGEVTVDGVRHVLSGVVGQRDHSWGVRDWKQAGWCWAAARLGDGTRLHVTDVCFPTFRYTTGYLQDGSLEAVTDIAREDVFAANGLPVSSRLVLVPSGLAVTATALAHGPTLLHDEAAGTWPFPRALAEFTSDRGTGVGWIEWNRNDQVVPPG